MTSAAVETHPDLIATIEQLKARPRSITLEQIAESANVSKSWLTQFASNRIPDPSFNKVMRLRSVLNDIAAKE